MSQQATRLATKTAASTPTVPRPGRRVPGEGGIWIVLFGDMLVFGVFFVTFMYERVRAPEVFDQSLRMLSIGIGLTNTLILLTGSLFVITAIHAIRSSERRAAQWLLVGALACGLAFVGLKAVEYVAKVSQGHTANQNTFFSLFLHPYWPAPVPRTDRHRGLGIAVDAGRSRRAWYNENGARRRRCVFLAPR